MNTGLILALIGGLVLTGGDILMKEWVETNSSYFFIFGLIIYIIGLVFLSFSFKYKNIAVASMIFVLFNIITLSIVSWFFFKEPLRRVELIGIMLGIFSIIVLES